MCLTYIMISWHVVICCVYCNYQGHNCSMSYYRYITGVYKSYWPELNRTLRSSSVPRTVMSSSIKWCWFQSQSLIISTQVPDLDSSRYVRGTSMPPNAYFSDSHSPYVARFSLFVFYVVFFVFYFSDSQSAHVACFCVWVFFLLLWLPLPMCRGDNKVLWISSLLFFCFSFLAFFAFSCLKLALGKGLLWQRFSWGHIMKMRKHENTTI